jgi:hypothetical protein
LYFNIRTLKSYAAADERTLGSRHVEIQDLTPQKGGDADAAIVA